MNTPASSPPQQPTSVPTGTAPTPKRRRGRWIALGLLALAGATIALAPTIAGWLAPSLAPGFVPLKGSVRLGSASFSWFGGQQITGVRLADPQGSTVATVDLSVEQGLFEILSGNLGVVRVSGEADIVRSADGTTNLQRAIQPKSPAPSSAAPAQASRPAPLRKGTAATLDLSATRIRFRDETARGTGGSPIEATLKNVKATASLALGQPIIADFKADAEADGQTGSITARAQIGQWHDAARSLTLGADSPATIDAEIALKGMPLSLADALLGRRDIAASLGQSLDASVAAAGTLADATFRVRGDAPNLKAAAELSFRDDVLSSASPATLTISGGALAVLGPSLVPALSGDSAAATITTYPNVSIAVDSLKASLKPGQAFDWRGLGMVVRLDTTALAGSVKTGNETRALSIAPLSATLDARDLANVVSLKASTSATLDNAPAGTIDVDLSAGGLTNDAGRLVAGVPAGLSGRASIRSIATTIAQPFVQSLGLNLSEQIGPTLDISLIAKAGKDSSSADLTLAMEARELKVSGDVSASANAIRSAGPITVDVRSAGSLASSLAGGGLPLVISPQGSAQIVIRQISLPLSSDRAPMLASANAEVLIKASDWALTTRQARGTAPILLDSLDSTLSLGTGGTISLASAVQLSHRGQRSSIDTNASLPGVLSDDPAQRIRTERLAESALSLSARSVPTSIASLLLNPAQPGELDLPTLTTDVLGSAVDLRLESTPQAGGKVSAVTGVLRAANLSADLKGALTPREFSVTAFTADAMLSPELADRVLPKLVADTSTLPTLVAPSTVRLSARPIAIPLKPGLVPDLAAATGVAGLDITADRPLVARTPAKAGVSPSIVGLADLRLLAESPLPAMLSGAEGTATLSMQAVALRGTSPQATTPAGTIKLAALSNLNERSPGLTEFDARIEDLSSAWIDELSGKPGLATNALGPQSTIVLVGSSASPTDLNKSPLEASLSISSPTIAAEPLRVTVASDRVSLLQPLTATWTILPAFADRFLASPGTSTAAMRLASPTPFKAELSRLSIALGEGPLKPGVFDLACTLSAPAAELTAADGTKTSFNGVNITTQREGNGLSYRLSVAEAKSGQSPPATNLALAGVLTNLAKDDGSFDADNLRVTAKGDLPAIPTVLLDTLAAKEGLLVEALGETTAFSLDAREFGRAGGSLAATARSPRAMFELSGPVQDSVLVVPAASPLKAQVSEVTTAFSSRIVKALPLFGSVEKGAQDRPASIVGTNLRIPLSNDLTKLDGDFAIDPGEVSFQIAGDFADLLAGPILAATRGKAAGKAGQRLAPMTVQVRAGVATLQRWSVPVGEFTIAMDGRINLASGEIDFITYIPAGALALEKLKLPAGIGGQIAGDVLKNAVIPVRTRGVGTTRKTEVDSDAAAKELLKGVDPGKLIERGLQDLFKPKKN